MFTFRDTFTGGFQLIQILGLLGMYFDAVVVEVEKSLLFFRLALAILCLNTCLVFSQVQKEASLSS